MEYLPSLYRGVGSASLWLVIVLLLAQAPQASAAKTAQETTAGQARRDQLAKTQEQIADPDPLARLANFEAIVASGDAMRTQVALRAALTSDDAELRGLAMRAYLATRREVTFDIVLPDDAQKLYVDALPDPDKLRQLESRFGWASIEATNAGKIRLAIGNYKFGEDAGTLLGKDNTTFTVSGDRFLTLIYVPAGVRYFSCFVEFRPTVKATFEGTLACKEGIPKLGLATEAF